MCVTNESLVTKHCVYSVCLSILPGGEQWSVCERERERATRSLTGHTGHTRTTPISLYACSKLGRSINLTSVFYKHIIFTCD